MSLNPYFKYVIDKIDKFNNFTLITHKNPDGDAIGSLTALGMGLKQINKNVTLVIYDAIPKTFNFLHFIDKIKKIPSDFSSQNLFILLDCASIKRTGFENIELVNNKKEIISIDHHLKEKGSISGLIDSNAAATTEIIFELLEYLNVDIDYKISTSLLTGLLTDTGGFQHSNTTSKTLQIAAKLLARGIPLTKISESVFRQKDQNILKIWGRALAKIKINPKTKMATSIITNAEINKGNISPNDISGVSSIINTAREINFALLLMEFNDSTKGSLRSEKEKGINVANIAKLFNGGGHALAAGFEIKGDIKNNIGNINDKIAKQLKIE